MHAVVPVHVHRGDHRGGAPVAARSMANQSLPARRAATQPGHIGLGRRLVDKDNPRWIEPALAPLPAMPFCATSGRSCSAAWSGCKGDPAGVSVASRNRLHGFDEGEGSVGGLPLRCSLYSTSTKKPGLEAPA